MKIQHQTMKHDIHLHKYKNEMIIIDTFYPNFQALNMKFSI